MQINQSELALTSESQPVRVGLAPLNTPLGASQSTTVSRSNPTVWGMSARCSSECPPVPKLGAVPAPVSDGRSALLGETVPDRFSLLPSSEQHFYVRSWVVAVPALDSLEGPLRLS